MNTKLFMRNDLFKILPAIRVCANASGEELNRLSTIPILVQNVSDRFLEDSIYGITAVLGWTEIFGGDDYQVEFARKD